VAELCPPTTAAAAARAAAAVPALGGFAPRPGRWRPSSRTCVLAPYTSTRSRLRRVRSAGKGGADRGHEDRAATVGPALFALPGARGAGSRRPLRRCGPVPGAGRARWLNRRVGRRVLRRRRVRGIDCVAFAVPTGAPWLRRRIVRRPSVAASRLQHRLRIAGLPPPSLPPTGSGGRDRTGVRQVQLRRRRPTLPASGARGTPPVRAATEPRRLD
jgi:hypothetical protein